jgi:hypothetical protein
MTATGTTIPVPAERCRAAVFDGKEHLAVQARKPRPLFPDEVPACRADDVGHLKEWPVHFLRGLCKRLTPARPDTPSPSSGFGQA